MFPAGLAVAGLIGCLGLAFGVAPQEIGIGLAILLVGIVYRAFRLGTLKRKKIDVF